MRGKVLECSLVGFCLLCAVLYASCEHDKRKGLSQPQLVAHDCRVGMSPNPANFAGCVLVCETKFNTIGDREGRRR